MSKKNIKVIKMVVKYSQFEIEVSEADFLTASDKMQKEYYDSVESLQRRELLRTDEKTWIEVLYWLDNGPTKDIINAFWANDSGKAFMGMIRQDSFKPLDSRPANSTQVRDHKRVD